MINFDDVHYVDKYDAFFKWLIRAEARALAPDEHEDCECDVCPCGCGLGEE